MGGISGCIRCGNLLRGDGLRCVIFPYGVPDSIWEPIREIGKAQHKCKRWVDRHAMSDADHRWYFERWLKLVTAGVIEQETL